MTKKELDKLLSHAYRLQSIVGNYMLSEKTQNRQIRELDDVVQEEMNESED